MHLVMPIKDHKFKAHMKQVGATRNASQAQCGIAGKVTGGPSLNL